MGRYEYHVIDYTKGRTQIYSRPTKTKVIQAARDTFKRLDRSLSNMAVAAYDKQNHNRLYYRETSLKEGDVKMRLR